MSFSREEIARLKAEFLVAFHQCGNASEAARRVGAKRGSVTGWLRAAGVVARGQAGPGSGHRRADHPAKAEYARLRAEGLSNTAAARRVGINPRTGRDWHQGIRHTANARIYPDGRVVDYNTGMTRKQAKLARLEKSIDARFLALAERELITDLLSTGASLREIARRLDRAPSTISRELRRNAPGNGSYGAYRAQRAAVARRERPKARKLDTSPRLRAYVIDKLRLRWSPEQICHAMEQEFPGEVEMRVTHETIYQALYVQACGSLRKEIAASVRTGRIRRKPRRTPGERTPRFSDGMVMISERPAEIEDRAVPGHWEGDLIMGAANASAIGTLVERSSRYLMLVHLPGGQHDSETVAKALTATISTLPAHLRGSLTWDQGSEMARHKSFSMATDMPVYFCDPASPWQRGSNENTNGLLRQYFPKGTDLSVFGPEDLEHVAQELNGRPRKTLGWENPAERFSSYIQP